VSSLLTCVGNEREKAQGKNYRRFNFAHAFPSLYAIVCSGGLVVGRLSSFSSSSSTAKSLPQCLHFMATLRTASAQNGHLLKSPLSPFSRAFCSLRLDAGCRNATTRENGPNTQPSRNQRHPPRPFALAIVAATKPNRSQITAIVKLSIQLTHTKTLNCCHMVCMRDEIWNHAKLRGGACKRCKEIVCACQSILC